MSVVVIEKAVEVVVADAEEKVVEVVVEAKAKVAENKMISPAIKATKTCIALLQRKANRTRKLMMAKWSIGVVDATDGTIMTPIRTARWWLTLCRMILQSRKARRIQTLTRRIKIKKVVKEITSAS
jgi:hypothetical protein